MKLYLVLDVDDEDIVGRSIKGVVSRHINESW